MGNDETHIIHRILKGETSLYEYFLDKYSQQVFILIIRIVENQEDAEELTQDTFLKAFEHLSSFKACLLYTSLMEYVMIWVMPMLSIPFGIITTSF